MIEENEEEEVAEVVEIETAVKEEKEERVKVDRGGKEEIEVIEIEMEIDRKRNMLTNKLENNLKQRKYFSSESLNKKTVILF